MNSFSGFSVANRNANNTLNIGQSFAMVSGVGGQSRRASSSNSLSNSWWATAITSKYKKRNIKF